MFISITDFYIEETDDSHILITSIDAMGQPEETKRFDKSNYDYGKWNQVGYLAKNTCYLSGDEWRFKRHFCFLNKNSNTGPTMKFDKIHSKEAIVTWSHALVKISNRRTT